MSRSGFRTTQDGKGPEAEAGQNRKQRHRGDEGEGVPSTEKRRSSARIAFHDARVKQIPNRHQQPPLGSFKLTASMRAPKMPQHPAGTQGQASERQAMGRRGARGALAWSPKLSPWTLVWKHPKRVCEWFRAGSSQVMLLNPLGHACCSSDSLRRWSRGCRQRPPAKAMWSLRPQPGRGRRLLPPVPLQRRKGSWLSFASVAPPRLDMRQWPCLGLGADALRGWRPWSSPQAGDLLHPGLCSEVGELFTAEDKFLTLASDAGSYNSHLRNFHMPVC